MHVLGWKWHFLVAGSVGAVLAQTLSRRRWGFCSWWTAQCTKKTKRVKMLRTNHRLQY